jgi:ABC-type dipeptide/oligopeptide/nickel transport system permease subunit
MAETTPGDVARIDYAVREHRSLWMDAWRQLISSRTAKAGLFIVSVLILSTVLAHYFWVYNPKTDLDYTLKLKPPTLIPNEQVPSVHIFGTDKLGRDIFRRVVHGGWNTLRVGVIAVTISLFVGGLLGLLAGFFESIEMNRLEKILLLTFLGGLMGFIPAWIAEQPVQLFLFALLGATTAIFENFLAGKPARVILFGAIGLLIGGGLALFVSPYTAIVTGILGGLIGAALSLQLGGSLYSNMTMRAMDIVLAFPSYLLAIAIVAFLGTGLEKGMIAIGIVGIPIYARLVRSSVLSVTQKEYILAAQSVGEGHGRIIFRHIFPNVLSPITVQATLGIGSAILTAAALGFLGLGAIPPEPEWGAMLGDSYKYLSSGAWWAVVFPGVMIMLAVLGFNLLGDGLRDALDPKMRT